MVKECMGQIEEVMSYMNMHHLTKHGFPSLQDWMEHIASEKS